MVDTILTIENGKVVRAFHRLERIGWIEEKLPEDKKTEEKKENE